MTIRIGYIDALKGLAILLMVMGHVIAYQFPYYPVVALEENPRETMVLFRVIYSFHMPLLMFCAGLFVLPDKEYSWDVVKITLWKRIRSLLIPYICAGAICYVSIGGDYWFIWMLFQFIALVLFIDILCSLLPKNYKNTVSTCVIVIVSTCIYIFYPKFYYLQLLPILDIGHWRQFPFFCMGVICARYDLCTKWFSINWVYTCALLLFGFLTYWITIKGNHIPFQYVTWCLLPVSAIVSLVYLFKVGFDGSQSRGLKLLQDIGRHSLEIYIIHVYFLFHFHAIGDFVMNYADRHGGGRTIFCVQLCSSFICAIVIIGLCYIVMNVINKSCVLSQLLLGRKSVIKSNG